MILTLLLSGRAHHFRLNLLVFTSTMSQPTQPRFALTSSRPSLPSCGGTTPTRATWCRRSPPCRRSPCFRPRPPLHRPAATPQLLAALLIHPPLTVLSMPWRLSATVWPRTISIGHTAGSGGGTGVCLPPTSWSWMRTGARKPLDGSRGAGAPGPTLSQSACAVVVVVGGRKDLPTSAPQTLASGPKFPASDEFVPVTSFKFYHRACFYQNISYFYLWLVSWAVDLSYPFVLSLLLASDNWSGSPLALSRIALFKVIKSFPFYSRLYLSGYLVIYLVRLECL
jgi:hypothetical protein